MPTNVDMASESFRVLGSGVYGVGFRVYGFGVLVEFISGFRFLGVGFWV